MSLVRDTLFGVLPAGPVPEHGHEAAEVAPEDERPGVLHQRGARREEPSKG